MDFRRINGLPPYVFAEINELKSQARRAGQDVIDLGFGNPDIPSPNVAVDKLAEAVHNTKNHRYSASRGIPKLRQAISNLYLRRFGVEIDPETEVVTTIGAKEGLSHLMWVLVGPGDTALVPSPSYPIHIYAPLFAGADVRQVRLGTDPDPQPSPPAQAGDGVPGSEASAPSRASAGTGERFFADLMETWESTWPKPRVIVLSFPHNPTTACVDLAWMQRIVNFAREHDVVLVHDFAYSDTSFDGYRPPSILEVPGAKDVAVELYTLTKSFSMAGWRVAFMVGNADIVAALTKLKSYLDYGTFQPIQIAAIVAMNEAPDYPKEVNEIYQGRRDALCEGLVKMGWPVEKPKGTMFVWAPIPPAYRDLDSLEFSKLLIRDAQVATSPGSGFGPGGDGFVRFALIENEKRIHQGLRSLKKGLIRLS
ncbi:MAG: aminotransferase class I/II-fold pyridoxal phosphate-dependent enzyme [Acidimicrobiales bacterium]